MAVELVNLGPDRRRSSLPSRLTAAGCGLLASIGLGASPVLPMVALAATGPPTCADLAPAHVLAEDGVQGETPDGSVLTALATYRTRHDADRGLRVQDDPDPDAVRAQLAGRTGTAAASVTRLSSTSGAPAGCGTAPRPFIAGAPSGAVWIDGLAQQGQANWYFCGPASLAEVAATTGHPVDQGTAAAWMGTNSRDGTTVAAMTGGLNHFVGQPIAHRDYYEFVWLDYIPTADQRSAFLQRLEYDVQHGWPLIGDAWEVPGGPHLVGHPPHQELFHWFEIGGYGPNGDSVYYADSATTLWSGVRPYSWYDTQTLVTILGGRGYDW
ncbi:MAG TPA: C39 family peptidase [Candidatus Dormibacteraeota bacterium]|nr:C39 family peptidase [Candidatus Dormibacteraeota bacterium]